MILKRNVSVVSFGIQTFLTNLQALFLLQDFFLVRLEHISLFGIVGEVGIFDGVGVDNVVGDFLIVGLLDGGLVG